jgi:drug/metabolite transporter (DMT)-like permease
VLLGVLYGVNLVASRFATGQFEPLVYVSLRVAIASLLYLGAYPIRPNLKFPTSRRLWLHSGVFGIIGIAIPMTCFVMALQYLSSGVVSLFQTLSPAMTIVLAHFFLSDERMNNYKVIGVIIAFSGALALFATGETGLAEFVRADWRGYALVVVAVLGLSASGVYGSKFLRDDPNYDVSTIRILVVAAILISAAGLTIGYDLSAVRVSGYLALMFGGVFGSFLAVLLNFYIIKRFGATAVSQSTYITPIVAILVGALLLDEIVTSIMILGMIMMFAGLTIINWVPDARN